MPWATHEQLLTLAHVSAADGEQSTICTHPCWSDPLFLQLAYATIMVHEKQIRSYWAGHVANNKTILLSLSEFIFMAQSAAVVIWNLYKTLNIAPLFVDATWGPFVPLALYGFDVHYDQRTVLQALATLTAWHQDPFATTIVVNGHVIPPVLLLFKQTTIQALHRAAPRISNPLTDRLRAFSSFNLEHFMISVHTSFMTYGDVTTSGETAYDALVNLAGIESLHGLPSKQQRFNAHNAVLAHYYFLTRPTKDSRSIIPTITSLMSAEPILDKRLDESNRERLVGFQSNPLRFQSDAQREVLLHTLLQNMAAYYKVAAVQYKNVTQLGKYDHGQYAKVCVQVANTGGAPWKLAAIL